jgi:hypothetical protein
MAIEVTVRDTETGQEATREVVDDYVIVVSGTCWVSNVQKYATGTHTVTIKGVVDPMG